MKNLLLLSILFVAGIFFLACENEDKDKDEADDKAVNTTPVMTKADSIKRGEYLSHVMNCHDCHTPKVMTDKGPFPDAARLLSGHQANEALPKITDKSMIAPGQWVLFSPGFTAAVGPWGTSFMANLTPHETGTGNWTLENFSRAMREGKSKGLENGRMLLPPMPWENYRALSDEDLANLWQYIRSLPPIDNLVPAPLPPS